MQDSLDRANGLVVWLLAQLGALSPDDLHWGVTQRRIRPSAAPGGQPQVEVVQAARPHPLYGMYERGEARLTRVAEAMARLGIEQRRQAVLERDGAEIVALFAAALGEYARMWQWTAQQEAEAKAVMVRLFREQAAVESGGPGG